MTIFFAALNISAALGWLGTCARGFQRPPELAPCSGWPGHLMMAVLMAAEWPMGTRTLLG